MKRKTVGGYPFDLYAYQSGMRYLNPGFKMMFAFITLLFCIIADNVWVSLAVILSMAYLTVCKGGLKLSLYISSLSIPLTFMVMGSVAIAAGVSKEPVGKYWINLHVIYVFVTADSLREALEILLKALGAVSAMDMMVLSTPASEMIPVLRKLHIPKLFIELMNMIYRFIFILTDVHSKLKNSAESRLGYRDFKTACRSFGGTAGNLLVLSWKKANGYYDALISRCYEGDLLFLQEEKKVTALQITGAFVYYMILTAIHSITR